MSSLLETAQVGDEAAFERLIEPHRRELHAHWYRGLAEAERTHVPFSLDVLTLDGDRIKEVTAFIVRVAEVPDGYARWPDHAADPRLVQSVFQRFGLPDRLD